MSARRRAFFLFDHEFPGAGRKAPPFFLANSWPHAEDM
jgi:hypothetical protein